MRTMIVKVRSVEAVLAHPNADRREIALVGGWSRPRGREARARQSPPLIHRFSLVQSPVLRNQNFCHL